MRHAFTRVGVTITILAALISLQSTAQSSDGNGSDPPKIAGVAVGDSAQGVAHALGAPARRQESLGLRFWDFPQRGISVTLDKADDRVHVITVIDPRAGAVVGVRVGDSLTVLRRRWGPPARVRERGRFMDFVHRGWTCTAEVHRGAVTEITLTLVERAP